MTSDKDALLQAIHQEPADGTAWLALADWLEESGQHEAAELVRLREDFRLRPDHPDRPGWERRTQELLAGGARPCVPAVTLELSRRVSLGLALVAAGRFVMGSPDNE